MAAGKLEPGEVLVESGHIRGLGELSQEAAKLGLKVGVRGCLLAWLKGRLIKSQSVHGVR